MALSNNWITEKLIDFEYKKYILLAFLKEVSDNFDENKLYPPLSDLINHYKQVISIKESKQNLLNTFPQKLSSLDMQQFKITYEKIIEDDSIMNEIEDIIEFSIPQFEHYLAEGKKIYDYIEDQVHIAPVGLLPLSREYGYMLINNNTPETKVYEYQISIFEQPDVKYRGIHVEFISTHKNSITTNFESIKNRLLKTNKKLPNPATFSIESALEIPFDETLLPIAKRGLVKYVSSISH